MAPPIYFFARTTRGQLAPGGVLSRAVLQSRGLDAALADVELLDRDAACFELTGPGPGAQSGCLLIAGPGAGGDAGPRAHYAPQFQTWTQVAPELWIGLDKEHPTTPADLQRRRVFPGYEIDAAGQRWTVPVIRDPHGNTALPRSWIAQGDEVVERIKADYVQVWEDLAEVCGVFFDAERPDTIPRTRALALCLAVLGINYRIGPHEQNLLGLVDSESWMQILGAAVDLPVYVEAFRDALQKKMARRTAPPQDSPVTSPGPEAEAPPIVPPAENWPC